MFVENQKGVNAVQGCSLKTRRVLMLKIQGCFLRTRRVLMLFKDVSLRTRRVLMLFKDVR